jgi:hypothetical protein
MLNVTDAVKTAYKSDSGATGFYLTIDNVEYASLTASKVQQGSVTLKESLTSSDYIDYSTAEKSELDFSIINTDANINSLTGKTIIAKQYAGTGNELVPLGIFTIKTPKANGDFLIDLVAYDNMDKFDIDVSKWWDDLVTWPITPLALLQSLCTYCGLTCDVVAADIINGSISITKNEDIDTTTGLNVLGWIQCICARWFKCDRATGHIKAVKLDSTVRETFSPSYTISDVSIADYTMPVYDALIIRSSENDIGTQFGTGTNPYIIQGNPLFYGFTNEQLQTVGTAILNAIQGFTYVPVSAKVMCLPYLEVGDYVTVSTIANKTGSAPILVREMNSANLRIDTLTSAGTLGTKKYVSASKSVLIFNQRMHEFKNDLDTLSSTISKTQKDSISKVTMYYLQNDGTTPSKEDTGWSTTMPTPITGQTMWSMQVYTKADDTTISKADPINITSTKGEKGDTGVGISTITTKYQGSANGTTAPTGTWIDTPPLLTDDAPYLWTQYTFTYTDNTTATSYTVTKKGDTGPKGDAGDRGLQGLQGPQGDQGIQGPKGLDGKSSYTHIAYATSSMGSGLSQTPTATTTYVGMYVDQTATDSTDPSKYKWTLIKGADGSQGTPGKAGADGKTPYLHTAYSWSVDGTDRFMTVYPGENLALNTSVPTSIQGSNSDWQNVKSLKFSQIPAGLTVTYSYAVTIDKPDTGKLYQQFGTDFSPAWGMPIDVDLKNLQPGVKTNFNKTIVFPKFIGTRNFNNTIGLVRSSALVKFEDLKVEIGNIPTPYTPSPLDDPEGAYPKFIGTYTDYIADDSTDPSKYTWAKLRGKDGKSIKSFSTEYYLSSSSVEQKDGSWTSVFPTKTPTTYIWYRNLITYTDNTTALSDPVLDSSANNFYTITETNTSNISQLNDRITNEVTSITTVTTQLDTRQTATDASVSKLQKDTTDSLTNLKTEQDTTAQALADYKNTVTTTYYTKSEIDQQADSVNIKIQQAVEDAQNKTITTLAETVVDARGFTVNTAGDDTHTTIDGAGVMVKDAQNNDVANFKASGSEIQKLKVINDVSMGAHNTQAYTDYELNEDTMEDGDSIIGSADFWIGDVK